LQTERYYFWHGDEIYADKISRFVIDCERNSGGLVTERLADIYDELYMDEFQDLAGYDLDLLETFFRARSRVVVVGDPRQCTYRTNNSARHSQYRGMGVLDLAQKWEADGLCQIDRHAKSHRCNQEICDYADLLWPDVEKTESLNDRATGHDGIFIVSKDNLDEYMKTFSPVLLRYNRRTRIEGYTALNFGNAKGQTYARVLIIPHGPIRRYLESGDRKDVAGSVEKFYVAITRARYSVAFLYDGQCGSGYAKWGTPADNPERG
jgi:DNA helicase-2/ATP-dependent DNA helicase PcrA